MNQESVVNAVGEAIGVVGGQQASLLLAKAGYDPRTPLDFWQRMEDFSRHIRVMARAKRSSRSGSRKRSRISRGRRRRRSCHCVDVTTRKNLRAKTLQSKRERSITTPSRSILLS